VAKYLCLAHPASGPIALRHGSAVRSTAVSPPCDARIDVAAIQVLGVFYQPLAVELGELLCTRKARCWRQSQPRHVCTQTQTACMGLTFAELGEPASIAASEYCFLQLHRQKQKHKAQRSQGR
jgi:hypothetical protein